MTAADAAGRPVRARDGMVHAEEPLTGPKQQEADNALERAIVGVRRAAEHVDRLGRAIADLDHAVGSLSRELERRRDRAATVQTSDREGRA